MTRRSVWFPTPPNYGFMPGRSGAAVHRIGRPYNNQPKEPSRAHEIAL